MNLNKALLARANSKCELCGSHENLCAFEVPPNANAEIDKTILICSTCNEQIQNPEKVEIHHWHCLNDSMWSEVPAVQVMAWRMLNRLSGEGWPQDLLDMLYLDEETLAWAQSSSKESEEEGVKHYDSHGSLLQAGDTVILTKDLPVKGANFTAKRGTAVRGISLVPDNPNHIEGKVNGQHIVILTRFVKKSY